MKKLMLWIFALATLQGGALFAQGLAGSWQGTLSVPAQPQNRDLRLVFKISTTDNDALKGTMYSIDQQGPGLPIGTVTLQGSTVKMAIPGIGGTYEGKMSADGGSIAGTFTQGPNPLPLALTRATTETAWTIPEPPKPMKPMRADANPVFEVATIKPSAPDRPGKAFTRQGRRFLTINTTLNDLITFAYNLHPRQITGGAAWMDTEKYDITGEPEGEGMPSLDQNRVMIQKLLADRFKLTFHHDKKDLSVYAIVVAKGGQKLTKSEGDANGPPGLMFTGLGKLPARNATLAEFASVMQAAVLDRPVVDQTGVTGRYDFSLNWTPDQSQFVGMGAKIPPPSDDPAAPPDLFTAFQQQLGLKLESTKAPVDVLVIDTVEKPSAN